MSGLEGRLESDPALVVIRRIALEQRTGSLTMSDDEREERLYFVSGELYLTVEHPLALALGSEGQGGETGLAGKDDVGKPGAIWFTQAVAALRDWTEGSYTFDESPAGITTDLVGPLPALSIVMADAVLDRDEFSLLRRLGGEEARYVASRESRAPAYGSVALDPGEAFVLSRVERPVAVGDLISQLEEERQVVLRALCRLLAVGLICNEKDLPRSSRRALVDDAMLEKFSKRIEDSLAREPLAMKPEDQRRKIADCLGRLGTMTYYEVLGVGIAATAEEIHAGFSDLARVVHPSNAERLGLKGKEGGMQLVFEKATEAYLTLSDRDRSRRYLLEVGAPDDHLSAAATGEGRQEEIAKTADENFKRAKVMVAREDYHFAVELLLQAVRVQPKAEYYALLANCQARNPRWLQKAVASYGRALQLATEDHAVRIELAQVLEAVGDRPRARREYEIVLSRVPGHPEASAGLERLKQPRVKQLQRQAWWQRLLGRS